MIFTEDITKHVSEKTCDTCEKEFTQGDKNDLKDRDQWHYTRKH